MTAFQIFNAAKVLAVAAEAFSIVKVFHPAIVRNPAFMVNQTVGVIGYMVVMLMMLPTGYRPVTYFFVGISLIHPFMQLLVPYWRVIDALICIFVLVQFTVYNPN